MANNFTPSFTGIERLGQFPLDKYSKFDSKYDAEKYALAGQTGASPAYVGQVLSVEDNGKVNVYVIDPNYALIGIASGASADTSSYLKFDNNTESGRFGVTLEAGAYLKQISITILEPFNIEDCFTVGTDIYPDKYIKGEDIIATEPGTYTYYFNEVSSEITPVLLWFKGTRPTEGKAILKIN